MRRCVILSILLCTVYFIDLIALDVNQELVNRVNEEIEQATKNLLCAVSEHNVEGVRNAIRSGADIRFKDADSGTWSPLLELLDGGLHNVNIDVVKSIIQELLLYDANVNAQDSEGFTALHHALWYPDIVQLLLNAGADLALPLGDDLDDKYKNATILHYAAEYNEVKESMKKILSHPGCVSVDAQDSYGKSALHNAVESNAVDMVQLLVDHKANVNIQDNKNNTPLHYATYKKNYNIVKTLLDNQADVNAKNKKNVTPLLIATYFNNQPLIRLLLSQENININVPDIFGCYPLHLVVACRNIKVVRLLLNKGVLLKPDPILQKMYNKAKKGKKYFAKEDINMTEILKRYNVIH